MRLDRFFGAAACVAVIVGVALAFIVIGTPGHARGVALDGERVQGLETIASAVHDRYRHTGVPGHLPNDLTLRDPQTQRAYGFQRLDREHYTLCASFSAASERDGIDANTYAYGGLRHRWEHRAGRTCYRFDATASTIDPQVVKQ